MALNIKNEDIHRAISELAKLRQVSLTQAVGDAVQKELDRERQRRTGMAERLLQIGRECAARMPPELRSSDHGEMLYDERGLPK